MLKVCQPDRVQLKARDGVGRMGLSTPLQGPPSLQEMLRIRST
jgi:hypothetical protein